MARRLQFGEQDPATETPAGPRWTKESICRLTYPKLCAAKGRNGHMKQTGLEVMRMACSLNDPKTERGPVVILTPLHTKGTGDSCHIEIPIESIPDMIEVLQHLATLEDR